MARQDQGIPRAKIIRDGEVSVAAETISDGGLVAFPTETVYGLGADATNDLAVAAIFEAKARPRFNPLIVHIADRTDAAALVMWNTLAEQLATEFWPGPLTLILPRRKNSAVSLLVSAGSEAIALRSPSHPIARSLLHEAQCPIAGPSANPAGRVSPTTADHVLKGLGDRIDLVIDGGSCDVGVESTVVDVTTPTPSLLRPGGLPREAIEAVLGQKLIDPSTNKNTDEHLRSPGQLSSHYAPKHSVRLEAVDIKPNEALLAFGPQPLEGAAHMLNLSPGSNLREAASHLFAMLHELDELDIDGIAVMPVPFKGLGEAINDRLQRAAVRP